ncbi:hypothetical protein PF010_g15843 [Phytophthora fragariae]|uniref:Uncharacterized protein n=1 Tax=Phytophthora fragariae TaxID=53985 RepID=A0A6G0KT07_9STRA|nr:hypothetical protein PF010_g15843 [Phytophthora fragariae]
MAILRAEVRSLVADTQLQQAIGSEGKAIESIRKAVESNGKAIESNGKAIESNGKAIESNGKAIESIRKAVEANEKAIETHGKSLKKMQDQIAVHDTLINALLPWATRDKLDDSDFDLIQRVRASNPDKVVLWALD